MLSVNLSDIGDETVTRKQAKRDKHEATTDYRLRTQNTKHKPTTVQNQERSNSDVVRSDRGRQGQARWPDALMHCSVSRNTVRKSETQSETHTTILLINTLVTVTLLRCYAATPTAVQKIQCRCTDEQNKNNPFFSFFKHKR
jgi:hypothetical protein